MAEVICRSNQTCRVCGGDKPTADFGPDMRRASRLSRRCRVCDAKRKRDLTRWRKDGPSALVCDICAQPEPLGKALAYDHCHDTGKLRGRLCSACNQGIGQLRDAPTNIASALHYLHAHGKALSTEEVAELVNLHQSPH